MFVIVSSQASLKEKFCFEISRESSCCRERTADTWVTGGHGSAAFALDYRKCSSVFSKRPSKSWLDIPLTPLTPTPPLTLLRYITAHLFFSLNCTFLLIRIRIPILLLCLMFNVKSCTNFTKARPSFVKTEAIKLILILTSTRWDLRDFRARLLPDRGLVWHNRKQTDQAEGKVLFISMNLSVAKKQATCGMYGTSMGSLGPKGYNAAQRSLDTQNSLFFCPQ